MQNINKHSTFTRFSSKVAEQSPNSSPKACVKIKQFKYSGSNNIEKNNKNVSKKQRIPIRALLKKLGQAPQFQQINEDQKVKMIMSQLQFYSSKKNSVDMSYRKFITPRDTTYNPKPFMFDRYNYENYENYKYKNPYKPNKYPLSDPIMKQPSRTVKGGTSKNLQIVFCEKKYKDFVQKANNEIHTYYQMNRTKSLSNIPRSKLKSLKCNTSRSQKKLNPYQTRVINKKSNLANYLQQFNTLQKLSQYMEREHKLNQKFLFSPAHDKSNTVLIQILIHRFDFLKKMKKKCQQLIFKTILNLQELPKYYKINIQDYLKFIQLFVYRDADCFTVSMFIFSFLFKQHQQITIDAAQKSLNILGGSANAHFQVQGSLKNIINNHENEGQKVFEAIKNNDKLRKNFIDLIIAS